MTEKDTTATDVAKLQETEKTKILEESVQEAKLLVDQQLKVDEREDVFKSELVACDSMEEMFKERGKKYIENTIKQCLTFPYLIKTNQEMLKEHLDAYEQETDDTKKKTIAENIFATVTQIRQVTAQIDAIKNISKQYEVVLEKLESELPVD